MSRFDSYLRSARLAIGNYKGDIPLAAHLKQFFTTDKKFGSTDRKKIAHLCYCFFRAGHLLKQSPEEEVLLRALFLCSGESNDILASLKPQWNAEVMKPFELKCSILSVSPIPTSLFPWIEELSDGIDANEFCCSFLHQPNLFLRIRPGQRNIVLQKLETAGIEFSLHGDAIALPNNTGIDKILETDKEIVIQDLSSQQVAGYFLLSGSPQLVWDACAGSGGKSILAHDSLRSISLIVTDKRASILSNLKKRFQIAGINRYKSFLADLSKDPGLPQSMDFDLVIADVPCTGSGTWARTPEQLYFFNRDRIEEYAHLQQQILLNIIPHVKKGGYLLYVTCSVFRKENEEQVEYLKENSFQLIRRSILAGYDKKADTMFAALLRRS